MGAVLIWSRGRRGPSGPSSSIASARGNNLGKPLTSKQPSRPLRLPAPPSSCLLLCSVVYLSQMACQGLQKGETLQTLKQESESLKKKLGEERNKLNDVERKWHRRSRDSHLVCVVLLPAACYTALTTVTMIRLMIIKYPHEAQSRFDSFKVVVFFLSVSLPSYVLFLICVSPVVLCLFMVIGNLLFDLIETTANNIWAPGSIRSFLLHLVYILPLNSQNKRLLFYCVS